MRCTQVPCVCGLTFLPDKLHVHQRSCVAFKAVEEVTCFKCDVSKCDVSKCDVSKCDVSKCDVSKCDVSKFGTYGKYGKYGK